MSFMIETLGRFHPHIIGPENWRHYHTAGYVGKSCPMSGCHIPQKFRSEAEAYEYADEHSLTLWRMFRVVPYRDEGWMPRERCRQDHAGIVPWSKEGWWRSAPAAIHRTFPYVNPTDPSKLTYTETPEKGLRNIQTVTRPGRYLRKFFGDVLSNDQIESWAQEWAALEQVEVQFARTEDEIEHVYTTGPHSCMSYRAGDFSSHVHPSRVYASPDLAVAYIERGGSITARAVVWPEQKVYSTIYGDKGRIAPQLHALGYSSGELDGARILRIEDDCLGGYVMPYIDGSYAVRDAGEPAYLTIDCYGEIQANHTSGLSEPGFSCDRCGDHVHEDGTVWIEGVEESWCEHCTDHHSFYCEVSGERYPDDQAVDTVDGGMVHHSVETWECAESGRTYVSTDCMLILENGAAVHEDCLYETVCQCDHDDELYWACDMTEVRPGVWVMDDNIDDWREENPDDDADATPRCPTTKDMFEPEAALAA